MPPIEPAAIEQARRALELQRKAAEERRQKAEADRQQQAQQRAAQLKQAQLAGRTDEASFKPVATQVRAAFDSRTTTRPAGAANLVPSDAPVSAAEQQASTDAEAVRTELEKSPQAAAEKLANLLEANRDPGYQASLIADADDVITDLARRATAEEGRPGKDDLQSLVDKLCDAGDACQPEQARALSDAFAAGLPDGNLGDDDDELGGVLRRAVSAGHGAQFGVELAQSLKAAGKGQTALEAAKFTYQGIHDARNDFEKARDDVNKLLQDVNGIAQDLAAAGRSPQEIADVITDFKKRHADAFQKFEDTGARLSATLKGAGAALEGEPIDGASGDFPPLPWGLALRGEAEAVLRDLPDLANTQAGKQAIADALVAQGKGEPSFLDEIPKVADDLREGDDGDEKADAFLDAVAGATLDAAGTTAAAYQQAGHPEMADQVLAGISQNSKLLRVDANALAKITSNLKNVSEARGPEAIRAAYAQLQESTKGLPPKTALGLKSAGAAFGVLALVTGAPGLSQADLNQKLQYVLGAAGTTVQVADVAGTAAGLLQKSSAFVDFAGFAGKAVPGLTAAVSALSAIDEFSKGDITSGAADTAITAGALLLLTPPPGDVVGAVLIAGGTLVKLFKGFFEGEGDGSQEADTKAALIRLGVPEAKAEQLKDLEDGRHYVGQFIGAEAKRLGVSPQSYLTWLTTLPDDKLELVMRTARGIDTDDQGKLKNDAGWNDPTFPVTSVETATAVLVGQGIYPPGTSQGTLDAINTRFKADSQLQSALSGGFGYQAAGQLLDENHDPVYRAEVIRRLQQGLAGNEITDVTRLLLQNGGNANAVRESLQAARDAGVLDDQQLSDALETVDDHD